MLGNTEGVYLVREPGAGHKVWHGHGEVHRWEGERRGFVAAPFAFPEIEASWVDAVPDEISLQDVPSLKECTHQAAFFFGETSREQYEEAFSQTQELLHDPVNPLRKMVLSRVIRHDYPDARDTFLSLCGRYPDAFVFFFSLPLLGTWIGASPELLFRMEDGIGETMALAGTRPAGIQADWDTKNIEEQRIVTDYLTEVLTSESLHPQAGEPMTVAAGPVEHICTLIRFNAADPKRLAEAVSPTPALCGFPKAEARAAIDAVEPHERGCYGGFCGLMPREGQCRFFVNLRSMCLRDDDAWQFAGGGIMPDSTVGAEWDETCRKAATLF